MTPAINICDLELIIWGQGTFTSAEEKNRASQEQDSQDKEVANGSTQSSLGGVE